MKNYAREADRSGGFTLIELLVVVIIIGILAAIAVPVYLDQREQAREASVTSSLRSAATYIELVADEADGEYPSTVGPLIAAGFRVGRVIVDDDDVSPDNDAGTYCIDAVHRDDSTVSGRFNSTVGAPEMGESGSRPACQ